MSGARRSFLFLQGLATPFFWVLAGEIIKRGHRVRRVNFCAGDRLFWPMRSAVNFRGTADEWPDFIAQLIRDDGITDIMLFGDCRPYHQVAIRVANTYGLAVHVFEEGYFRPSWITVERGGTNAFSSLPRDPATILADEGRTEVGAEQIGGGFVRRVCWEGLYQLATLALSPAYSGYRRHRPYHPAAELAGWAARLARRPWERSYSRKLSDFLIEDRRPFYLFPLQLQSDYQIRKHSPFADLGQAKELILESFAKHAPADAALVIKVHPLDNGLVNHRRRVYEIARRLNLLDRVFIIDGGHLPTLLTACRGVVVINSTTGLSAMHHERPVKVLGQAIFNIPGLCFQDSLDAFWTKATAPDQALYRAFRRLVMKRSQVNGSFFSKDGIPLAVQGVIERLEIAALEPQAAGVREFGAAPAVRIESLPVGNG